MSYFKRFGDVCSGISAFMVLIYLFRTFMSAKVIDEEMGIVERVKEFLSPTAAPDKYLLAVLALMLIVSGLAGCVFSKLPYLTPIFSLPPLLFTLDLIKSEYIVDYPVLHLLLAIFAFLGGIYECARRDKEDGKRRSAVVANIVCVGFALFLLSVYKKAGELEAFGGNALTDLNAFDREIFLLSPDMNMAILLVFASLSLVLAVISIILRDIYFIDAALALPPAMVLIYLWGAAKLSVHPEMIVAFSLCVLASRIVPMFMCTAKR